VSAPPTGSFPALRVRDYRVYWSAGVLSNVGTSMQGTALDWFVLTRTHSGTAVGWTTGLQFAPVLLFGLWGGVVADRKRRRPLQLAAQSLYALQALILTIAVFSGHSPIWLIYLLAFGLGCVFTVENPARLAFVAELVGGPLIPNAAGLNILSLNAARLVGPAIAGLLISTLGTGWVFAINFLSFSAVLTALLTIRPRALPRTVERTSWIRAGREGLRYIVDRPGLLGVFAIFGLASTFAVNFPITLTLFAGRIFNVGSTGLGLMSTALSVGTVAGTLAATRRSAPGPRRVVISALLFAVAEMIAAFAPRYWSFLILLMPVGFLLMTLNTAVSAYAQTHVDEAVRGRVMAFYTVISMGGTPIGGPIIGWISQHAGARPGLVCGAVVAAFGTLGVGLWLARGARRSEAEALLQPVPVLSPASPAPPGAALP
jgi:MFS family permease